MGSNVSFLLDCIRNEEAVESRKIDEFIKKNYLDYLELPDDEIIRNPIIPRHLR